MLLAVVLVVAATAASAAAAAPKLRMQTIEFENGTRVTLSVDDVAALAAASTPHAGGRGFFDVTNERVAAAAAAAAAPQWPPLLASEAASGAAADGAHRVAAAKAAVGAARAAAVDPERIVATVRHLSTEYPTRFYDSPSGVAAAQWIGEQYDAMPHITAVNMWQHSGWAQPSVVARWECAPADCVDNAIVVFGGHIDSIASDRNVAPGADDDAAGSAVVMEIARAAGAAGTKLARTVEFHGYAAEEGGLRGSAEIAAAYKASDVKVAGMINYDLVGFVNGNCGVARDGTEATLSDLLGALAQNATTLEWQDMRCGFACSDHFSWARNGYRSAHPAESGSPSRINPHIHTAQDTLDKLNADKMSQFSRLGLAMLVALASNTDA